MKFKALLKNRKGLDKMSLNIEHKHFQSMIKVKKRPGKKMAFYLMLVCLLGSAFSGVSKQESAEEQKLIEIELPEGVPIDEANIYFGNFSKKITNPKCIDMVRIINNSEEYKIIQKDQISRGSAKYWILLNQANEFAFKCIKEFVEERKINILFERNVFFKALKKVEAYKDLSEAKLMKNFDVTNELISYINTLKLKSIETPKKH